MNETQASVGLAGDTGESEVLTEAVRVLGDWARRLPEDSPWAAAFAEFASDVAAGIEVSRVRRGHVV